MYQSVLASVVGAELLQECRGGSYLKKYCFGDESIAMDSDTADNMVWSIKDMENDLEKAEELLKMSDYTCVLCKGVVTCSSRERGIAPLMQWVLEEKNLTGYSAADRIVGRAAAFLYILLEVKAVYATVMSRGAIELLEENGIHVVYDTTTNGIRNRTGDGMCPMEKAVLGADSAQEAFLRLREKLLH